MLVLSNIVLIGLTSNFPEKMTYDSAAQRPTTTILLRNMRKLVTPVSTASLATFLSSRKKASLAEVQKLFPDTAHMM